MKKAFLSLLGYVQHPKAGRNTQKTVHLYCALMTQKISVLVNFSFLSVEHPQKPSGLYHDKNPPGAPSKICAPPPPPLRGVGQFTSEKACSREKLHLLCIFTCKWVLHTPFSCQNHLFGGFKAPPLLFVFFFFPSIYLKNCLLGSLF